MTVIFWIIASVMALGASALLAVPLLRARRGDAPRGAHALEVYRLQLAELAGEEERGVVSSAEATGARLEIERRMLRADNEAVQAPKTEVPDDEGGLPAVRVRKWPAAGLAILTPLLAFAVYLAVGSPDLSPTRDAGQVTGADTEHMDMLALTQKLAVRLETHPEDIQGWMLLGRSYVTLENFPKALNAYAKAVALAGDRPAPMVLAEYGETLVQANNGQVGEDARLQFRKVLKIVPDEPRSRFYLGLAKAQTGDTKGALDDWVALLKQAEPGAPWAGAVREQAQEIANLLKVDLAQLLPEASPASPIEAPLASASQDAPAAGPDAAGMEAAAAMPEGDRKIMIESMVARLAARQETSDKSNVDGWLKLARAYGVLGRKTDSLAALARAVEAGPARMDALSAYGEALQAAGETKPVSERFARTMRQILTVEPANNQALWFLGAFSAQQGDKASAKDYWEKLQAELPPDSPEYRSVATALKELSRS